MLPKDTAQRLGIAKPTLRKWALEFAPWLSDGALAPGKGHERHYSADDIKMLQRVQHMLGERYTYDEVKQRLGMPEATSKPTERATASQDNASVDAIATNVVVLQEQPELGALRQLLEAQRQTLEAQQVTIASQSTLIDQHQVAAQMLQHQLERATASLDKVPRWLRLLLRI